MDLPSYFNFTPLLNDIENITRGKNLSSLITNPRNHDGVNYTFFANKDGKYAWRPFQLIHPILYISLINIITEQSNWLFLRNKFKDFAKNKKIKCLSLPVVSLSEQKDKAEQVTQWWQEFEQKSISLALEYEYIIQTDITDCYSAIYTHSIVWALHSKQTAKAKRHDKNLLGNSIDSLIQDMRLGQTNGIPQGSVLMDFISEIVLGYADVLLSSRIEDEKIKPYQILRYRDDYRIFVNDIRSGEKIVKILTEIMLELGMKLNPTKTGTSNDIIRSSIKEDKLAWIAREKFAKILQKHF